MSASPPHPNDSEMLVMDTASTFQEGVWFGMPDEAYFAIPALSATGIKHLRISPLDFWARASWLNPNYEDDTADDRDNEAKVIGKAYHARILEGRETFLTRFAPDLDPKDFPGVLRTVDDLKGWLEAKGLPKSGKTKAELIDRVLAADPTAKIWDVICEGYLQQHQGKSFLPPRLMDKIELAAAMIEKHPELSKAFSGGMPEVVICWRCPDSGVPCKARLDYLKPKAIVDLKTFANMQGRPIDLAIARELATRKYHVQAAWYDEAASHVARLMTAGKVYGEAPHDYLSRLFANQEKTFLFVWQAKGPAPLARGKTLPREGATFRIGQTEIDVAKVTFQNCMERFGKEPWIDVQKIEAIDDSDVPPWAYD